tara:strand:+ start:175 stop:447 length:273 start_codon:yes stop_codon:yes gene_type:complete
MFVYSCGTIKEGFTNQKKTSSDEFLVEKKSPLVMPPDFDDLPIPKTEESKNINETNKIKELVSNDEIENKENNVSNKNFEETLIEKIQKN